MRPADGRFERLQRHRENIRRIARELNVDFSSGLPRSQCQSASKIAGVRPETPLFDETSRRSKASAETSEVGEEVFDALRHYELPKTAPEMLVSEMSEGNAGQGSPGDARAPSVVTPEQTLTHTGSSAFADAPGGASPAETALIEMPKQQVEPTLQCPSCGHAASAGQRFCQHCGQRLEVPPEDPTPSPKPGASRVLPREADEPAAVDETFGSILSRWRQQYADFQRAQSSSLGPEIESPLPTFDGDPEAFVQRIKRELGIDAGPLAFEPSSTPKHQAEAEIPFSPSNVLRQIQALSASFEAQAEAFKQDGAPPAEAEATDEPLESKQVEAQAMDVATGSPKSAAEEALLSRLVALETEVLKLRGESAGANQSMPELDDSPRRPPENVEKMEVEVQQAMSSLGMSLLSSSSLFASVSDPGQEVSPEHRDEGHESEAEKVVQAEPKKVVPAEPTESCDDGAAIEAEAKEAKPDIATRPSAESTGLDLEASGQGAAFFVPFTAPRKDTAVQVPEETTVSRSAAAPVAAEPLVPGESQQIAEVGQKDSSKGVQAQEEELQRPADSPPQPAFIKANKSADLKGVAAPCLEAQTTGASAEKQQSIEAGSGPLPSKTAGPPRPRSSQESRKPLSPQRLRDVPWPKSPTGPGPPSVLPRAPGQIASASISSPPPAARWPELPRPPAFLPDSFPLGVPSAAEINGLAAPPSWQGLGWRSRDQAEEDVMLQRAYEVYRQQQLELLRQ